MIFWSLSLHLEGIWERYPIISDGPKKALSNPRKGSIELPKRFYRTPQKGPWKGSIEPQWKGLQNHRRGSIEPFASNLPFSGYPFKIFPKIVRFESAIFCWAAGGFFLRFGLRDSKSLAICDLPKWPFWAHLFYSVFTVFQSYRQANCFVHLQHVGVSDP